MFYILHFFLCFVFNYKNNIVIVGNRITKNMQEHQLNTESIPKGHELQRCLSYNDVKKRRMLREEKSKKKLRSLKKLGADSEKELKHTSSSTVNITMKNNKYIK